MAMPGFGWFIKLWVLSQDVSCYIFISQKEFFASLDIMVNACMAASHPSHCRYWRV